MQKIGIYTFQTQKFAQKGQIEESVYSKIYYDRNAKCSYDITRMYIILSIES